MGEDSGRYFMKQMIDALSYLHKNGIVHQDLKTENILIDSDLNLKVADFGFACNKSINQLHCFKGTKTYMAPEIKERKTYDGTKTDIFSLGMILFIIVTGTLPFLEAS